MFYTKVLSLTGLCWAATSNCVAVVGGLSMSGIRTKSRSKMCTKGFISGLLGDQSMTSVTWFSRKPLVYRAVWGGASFWTRTKLLWKVALAQDKRLCWIIRLYTCWFMVPSSTASWIFPPYWNPSYTIADGLTWPPVPSNTNINMPPILMLMYPRSSICVLQPESCLINEVTVSWWRFVQWWRRRRYTKISLGHWPPCENVISQQEYTGRWYYALMGEIQCDEWAGLWEWDLTETCLHTSESVGLPGVWNPLVMSKRPLIKIFSVSRKFSKPC